MYLYRGRVRSPGRQVPARSDPQGGRYQQGQIPREAGTSRVRYLGRQVCKSRVRSPGRQVRAVSDP